MKILTIMTIISFVWAARQPGKENEAEEQMPETIWIGSPYGLIPYDIDWAYFNKTKEHVLREADKQRKVTKARTGRPTISPITHNGPNEKAEASVTLEDVLLSTTTIEPISTLQSTTCNDEQEDTTVITTEIPEKETKSNEVTGRIVTSPPSSSYHATAVVVSHINRTHRPRLSHKPWGATLRPNKHTTLSARQRTFPRIPYDIDDLLIASTVPSTSDVDMLRKSSNAKSQERSYNNITGEISITGRQYEAVSHEEKGESTADHKPSRGYSRSTQPTILGSSTERQKANAELSSISPDYKPSAGQVETSPRSAEPDSAVTCSNESEKRNRITENELEASSNNDSNVNTTKSAYDEVRRANETLIYKEYRKGNCSTVTDILALSNYLQLKITESLLSGSLSWPTDERGHFRGMVNHMRRKLQAISKKSTEKDQFKIIRGHLIKYMGDNKERRQLVLPISIGQWGTVLQLLDCLKKKRL